VFPSLRRVFHHDAKALPMVTVVTAGIQMELIGAIYARPAIIISILFVLSPTKWRVY